jgi:hypothetical protein
MNASVDDIMGADKLIKLEMEMIYHGIRTIEHLRDMIKIRQRLNVIHHLTARGLSEDQVRELYKNSYEMSEAS